MKQDFVVHGAYCSLEMNTIVGVFFYCYGLNWLFETIACYGAVEEGTIIAGRPKSYESRFRPIEIRD